MFIDFEKYAYTITNVSFEGKYKNECRVIILQTDGGVSFKFKAMGYSVTINKFREFENYEFTSLIGKKIEFITAIEIPDYYIEKYNETDIEKGIFASYYLYQINFVNSDEIFQFIFVNLSEGDYEGWIETEVIESN